MAQDLLLQAVRLNVAVGAPAQVLERDLAALNMAAGNPAGAIALIDPRGNRDDFLKPVRWGSPGQAFQLAEAYRAQGNVDAPRRLYRRAQEAATAFDEQLSQQLARQYARLETQYGQDVVQWATNAATPCESGR